MNLAFPESERAKEVSSGVITSRNHTSERNYLILKHENGGHWSFPKGHLEKGEQPKETAVRELYEETGLKVKEFIPGFSRRTSYTLERGGKTVSKTVIYFLGLVSWKSKVRLSPEHRDYSWLSYREARSQLTYENDKELLDSAEKRLKGES